MTLEMKYKEKYNEGQKNGLEQGITLTKTVFKLSRDGYTEKEIAAKTNLPVDQVKSILE